MFVPARSLVALGMTLKKLRITAKKLGRTAKKARTAIEKRHLSFLRRTGPGPGEIFKGTLT
ncbi:MAG: hypothetical protein COV67_13445 [Nitrospinae bacterium CG11_big_fil_rev_8_21_14_0_20_56_8]|nr:MAG: hypothetical protein COV67_13445 [Nitrospinae bacterium CG11_big_fil_rev_8_21_14_0_20_56_8]